MAAAPRESPRELSWRSDAVDDGCKAWVIGGPACVKPLRTARHCTPAGRNPPQADDIELACLPASPSAAPQVPDTPRAEEPQSQPRAGAGASEVTAPPMPCLPVYRHLHSFDLAGCPVSILKFAPGPAGLLAWGAADGTAYIATAEQPPRLLQVLEGHRARVADLDWSLDGCQLLTCSADGAACLWRAATGRLARAVRGAWGPLSCCCFHPSNPNLLLLGTAAGRLLAVNASTGRLAASLDLPAAPMAGVGAACLAPAGPSHLLVADSRGCVHLLDAAAQRLAPLARFPPPGGRFHEPACLQFVPRSAAAGGPALLLALSSGEMVLSALRCQPWRLQAVREVRWDQASAKVRACLRPGAPQLRPELLLAGGEDCLVHLVDVSSSRQRPRLVAALAAHEAPVLGVSCGGGERWLASCDKRGVVALWEADAAAGLAAAKHAETQPGGSPLAAGQCAGQAAAS